MRRLGVTFALALFLLGTLASEAALARGGGRGGGSQGAGFHGGGHRGGSFHGGKHFHHGGKHFHHGQGRVGVFVGAPLFFGGWGYPSPFYYPPPVYYPSVPYYPPTYIERGNGQAVPEQQPAPAYWYYCPGAKAYHPYVTECPGGWQQVVPQPPPPS